MRTAEYTTPAGHRVRIHDPLEPGTPEWEARQLRWKKALADFAKSVPSLWQGGEQQTNGN